MYKILAFFALAFLACSDVSGPVAYANLSLSIIGGQDQRDTVMTRLSDFLAVEVLNGESPAQGVLINFVVLEDDCGQAYAPSVLTNASGRAQNVWDLGRFAGPCTMEARAIDNAGNPVSYGTFNANADPGPMVYGWPELDISFEGATVDLSRFGMEDQYGNRVHWRVTIDAYAHVIGTDSTVASSKIFVPDSAGTTLASIRYAGQVICRPTVTITQNGDKFRTKVAAPTPARGGCASTL